MGRLKHPTEDRTEEMADRFALEIDEPAARMTPEERERVGSETMKIASRVPAARRS